MISERRFSRMVLAAIALLVLWSGAALGQTARYSISSVNINNGGTMLTVVVNAPTSSTFGVLSQSTTSASNISVPVAFPYGSSTMPATTFALTPITQMVGSTPVQKVGYNSGKTQASLYYSITNGSTLPLAIPAAAALANAQILVNINLVNTGGSGAVSPPTTPPDEGTIIIVDPCPPCPTQPMPPSKTLPVVYYYVQPAYYIYPAQPGCGCSPAR